MKIHLYILLIGMCLPVLSSANQDSLMANWKNQNLHDTVRMASFNKLIWEYYLFSNPDSAYELSKELIDYASKVPNKKFKAIAFNNQGISCVLKGEHQKAIDLYNSSLELYEQLKDVEGSSKAYNNIGMIYKEMGNHSKAIDFYMKSLKLKEQLKDSLSMASTLNNIGNIYNDLNDYEKALEYYKKGFELRDNDDKKGLSTSYNNLASVFMNQGKTLSNEIDKRKKLRTALAYYKRSYRLSEEVNDGKGMANTLINLGLIMSINLEYDSAISYFEQSINLQEQLGDKPGLAFSYNNIGGVHYSLGNYQKAIEFYKKGYELAKDAESILQMRDAVSGLHETYSKTDNYKAAYAFINLYNEYNEAINSEENQQALAQKHFQYEYEKQKAIDDAQHEKQLAIQEEEKARQELLTIFVAIGLLIVIAFLLFVFNRLKITKRQNVIIEQQKKDVEHAHREITDSINYAERIQRSFLASDQLLNEYLKEYFVFFQPKEAVSGDFYWAGQLNNENFALVNADSTGHGVPGAIMSILNISSIEKAVEKGLNKPSDIFNETRRTIIERLKKDGSIEGGKDGMDASIICFDFKGKKMAFTLANNPLWVIREGQLIQFKPEKMPVGKHENDHTPFTESEFDLQEGDQIYSLTDGFQDQFGGPKQKKYMVKRMKAFILSISNLPMLEQQQKMKNEFNDWKGEGEQVDDVCVIGVRI